MGEIIQFPHSAVEVDEPLLDPIDKLEFKRAILLDELHRLRSERDKLYGVHESVIHIHRKADRAEALGLTAAIAATEQDRVRLQHQIDELVARGVQSDTLGLGDVPLEFW